MSSKIHALTTYSALVTNNFCTLLHVDELRSRNKIIIYNGEKSILTLHLLKVELVEFITVKMKNICNCNPKSEGIMK